MDVGVGGNGPVNSLRFGWKGSNTYGGYLANGSDVSNITFTGQHRNKSANQMVDFTIEIMNPSLELYCSINID